MCLPSLLPPFHLAPPPSSGLTSVPILFPAYVCLNPTLVTLQTCPPSPYPAWAGLCTHPATTVPFHDAKCEGLSWEGWGQSPFLPLPPTPAMAQPTRIRIQPPRPTFHGAMNESRDSVCMHPCLCHSVSRMPARPPACPRALPAASPGGAEGCELCPWCLSWSWKSQEWERGVRITPTTKSQAAVAVAPSTGCCTHCVETCFSLGVGGGRGQCKWSHPGELWGRAGQGRAMSMWGCSWQK